MAARRAAEPNGRRQFFGPGGWARYTGPMPRRVLQALRWLAVVMGSTAALQGCASGVPERALRPAPLGEPWHGRSLEPQAALCSARVAGHGVVDVERDYLPRVVSCENGGAGFEALKAQAVAARSYLRHTLERRRSITDGAAAQVYSCGRAPRPEHYRAVAETAGQILRYRGTTVAAFYVAGAKQTPPSCTDRASDRSRTERYVTYNGTRAGEAIRQSKLGRIASNNLANRGAMSQNGAGCLARLGWSYEDVLRFYYGRDIEIARTYGPCAPPPVPAQQPPAPAPEPPPAAPSPDAAWAHAAPPPGTQTRVPGHEAEATGVLRIEDFDPSHEAVGPGYP